jgi:hypothetical protein
MINLVDLPSNILRYIQDFQSDNEKLLFPIVEELWIDTLKFPKKYPIQSYDIISFNNWICRRYTSLCQCVTILIIYNHCDFLKNPIFISILQKILFLPKLQYITLGNFRPNYLIFDSIPLSVTLLLKQKFSILQSLKYLKIDVNFLFHINPNIQIDTLHIGFEWSSYYLSDWTKSYTADRSIYPLKIFLEKMKNLNGHIKNLNIYLTTLKYDKFDFLFTSDIYKIINNIHFQCCIYNHDPILMMWKKNQINYSVSTSFDIKCFSN